MEKNGNKSRMDLEQCNYRHENQRNRGSSVVIIWCEHYYDAR